MSPTSYQTALPRVENERKKYSISYRPYSQQLNAKNICFLLYAIVVKSIHSWRDTACSDSKLPDVQAGFERAMTLTTSILTGADIMMSFPIEIAMARGFLDQYEALLAYLERIQLRPAYQSALKKGGD